MNTVVVDGAAIADANSFHEAFAAAFGFPAIYGNNMDAWVDCMTSLDDPDAGMSKVHVGPGQVLTIAITNAAHFKAKCPDLWLAFLECAAFVNHRRMEQGESAVLAVSAYD
jgi:hypothetical protein